MNTKLFSVAALVLAFELGGATFQTVFASDALVQPIPTPDLSKLPAASAEQLRKDREAFEKMKVTLVGPELAEEYALMGAAYVRSGFYDVAAVAFDDVVALAPGDARWLYVRGMVARMQKHDSEAIGYFERALALDKVYLPIRVALVTAQIQRGDFDTARKLLEEYVTAQTEQAVPIALLGEVSLRQKRYPEAVDHFKRALRLDPNATRWYAELADAYAGAGNAKDAESARAKIGNGAPQLADPIGLGLIPNEATAVAPVTAVAGQAKTGGIDDAEVLFAARQYDAARLTLDALLKQKPNDAHALALYARVDATEGNTKQAQAHANAAIDAAPKEINGQMALGFVDEVANDEAGARRAYEKAIELDPNSGEARLRLGNTLMRAHQYEQAAAQYRALTQTKAVNATAWTRLVAASVAGDRCADAIKDVNAGLAKDPKNGILMQLFVRTSSTCSAVSAEEKKMALDYGGKLYKQTNVAPIGEAYALALAANGKWDDAVKTQEAAMFTLIRDGGKAEIANYRETLQKLRAHKMPDRAWSANSVWFNPPRAMANAKPGAGQPAK